MKAIDIKGFQSLATLNIVYDVFILFGYFVCARKVAALKAQANLSTSSLLLSESTVTVTEVSTVVTEEVSIVEDQPAAEECTKDK